MSVFHGDARPLWITSSVEGVDHAVWDQVFGEYIAASHGNGFFPAVCGSQVLPASLAAPPQPPCSRCMAVLRARASSRDVLQRMAKRRPSQLERLFHRRIPLVKPRQARAAHAQTAPASAGLHPRGSTMMRRPTEPRPSHVIRAFSTWAQHAVLGQHIWRLPLHTYETGEPAEVVSPQGQLHSPASL
jgi:hypothetical protein